MCVLAVTGATAFVTGCQSNNRHGLPLPKAWPRLPIEQHDSMVTVAGLPLPVNINPDATFQLIDDGHPGLTVSYPAVGTKIYFTFVKTRDRKEQDQVVRIRKQRIALNLNGAPARMRHSTPDSESDATLVVARSGVQTPVQLLATVGDYVVTATAFIDDPQAAQSYDSISPIVRVVEHDMAHALDNVTFETSSDRR